MRRAALVAACVGTVLAVSAPAQADGPVRTPAPSGTHKVVGVCPFPVRVTSPVDNGHAIDFGDHLIFQGHLVDRATNLDTGKSIVINASGPLMITFNDDGSLDIVGPGPQVISLFSTDEGGPAILFIHGRLTFHVSENGDISNLSTRGTVQDLCAMLG